MCAQRLSADEDAPDPTVENAHQKHQNIPPPLQQPQCADHLVGVVVATEQLMRL
jgi:hypothetical protein